MVEGYLKATANHKGDKELLFTSSLQGGDGGACKVLGWLLGSVMKVLKVLGCLKMSQNERKGCQVKRDYFFSSYSDITNPENIFLGTRSRGFKASILLLIIALGDSWDLLDQRFSAIDGYRRRCVVLCFTFHPRIMSLKARSSHVATFVSAHPNLAAK
ncbi:hypothetical protein Tco_0593879 [Tanacetum coccineum]